MASSGHLRPGERGSLAARVDTHGRRGLLVKTIEVLSNDLQRRRVVLTLKAEVREAKTAGTPQQPGPTGVVRDPVQTDSGGTEVRQ
jgi:hypothetical protein